VEHSEGKTLNLASQFMIQLLRHWNGRGKLWSAFWLFGVLGSILVNVVFLVYMYATGYFDPNSDLFYASAPKAQSYIFIVYLLFAFVAIWRCATNVKFRAWTTIARIFAGFWLVVYSLLLIGSLFN
jgi:hypothetical protein